MKCNKCGAEITDNSLFCTECGTKVEKNNEQPEVKGTWFSHAGGLGDQRNEVETEKRNEQQPDKRNGFSPAVNMGNQKGIAHKTSDWQNKNACNQDHGDRENDMKKHTVQKNGKKKGLIAAIAGVGVLVVAAVVLAFFLKSPAGKVNSFSSLIESKKYSEALAQYNGFSFEEQTKANQWMSEYIASVEQDYYDGKLDYATASRVLDDMEYFDAVSEQAATAGYAVYYDNEASRSLNRAKELVEKKEWEQAYYELSDIDVRYKMYDEVSALRDTIVKSYREETLKKIEEYGASGQIEELSRICDDAQGILPGDREILDACQKYYDSYVTKTLESAAAMAQTRDFVGAVELLEYASGVYHDSRFTAALEEYDSKMPRKLADCQVIDCASTAKVGINASDCFGNNYQNAVGFYGTVFGDTDEYASYAVFFLNGNYEYLSGTIVGSDMMYEDMEVSVKIFGDGKLIYESPRFGRTTYPENINLDVAAVKQLRIEYMYYKWNKLDVSCICDLSVS